MRNDGPQKITSRHLRRNAYLYIRQSSIRQVFENTESTERQYALRQRAVALGWPQEQIIVIDSDQGQSGASSAGREGFQKLVAEVGMAHAGIVMGLEVSRLARNSSDWHRLLEICALTDTLILDEDGVYDPSHFNDRLLLGLKGTMSEAELHVLHSRLRGGILNKARRGELEIPLPVGFVYDAQQRVILDPDRQVQETLRLLFQTFRRTGSAMGTVKYFREKNLLFPRRARSGPHKGEILWGRLEHSRVLFVLHNPRFAGAFCFGRTRQRHGVEGRSTFAKLPQDEWIALLPGAHDGYITWQEFEENARRLRENAQAIGEDRKRSPPREGPALLQGLAVCGVCGARMTVRYHQRKGELIPDYVCHRDMIRRADVRCQRIPGASIDAAISKLLVETMTPMALEVALSVEQELQSRFEEADRLRAKNVERARYEAELARRRYMKVDPDNRLVADELEAIWNEKLRAVADAQAEYERERTADRARLDEEQRARVRALATDFPRLWRDPKTADRERKRMVRLLLDDVTLIKAGELTVQVRFRGGATKALTLPAPKSAWEIRQTTREVVAEIDQLINDHTDSTIARILNERGRLSGEGRPFKRITVWRIRRAYRLKGRYTRLRERGMLTLSEMAKKLRVKPYTVRVWRRHGLLKGHAYDDRNDYLYEPPGANAPVKGKWKLRRRTARNHTRTGKGVQYET